MLKIFHTAKMRIMYFSPLQLLILIIVVSCFTITNCSDPGRKRDKDVSEIPSTSRTKKVRNAGEGSSKSKATSEAGSSSRVKKYWSMSLNDDILNTYFNEIKGSSVNWKRTYPILCKRHPNLPSFKSTQTRVHSLLQRIIQSTPAWGEGQTLWTKVMKSELLRIYYQTRPGDPTQHAYRIYYRWRSQFPLFPNISPKDLLHQVENMLIRRNLLDPPEVISEGRKEKIWAVEKFKFNSEQEDILRDAFMRTDPNEPLRIDSFYTELCEMNPIFCRVSPHKVLMTLKHFSGNHEEQEENIRDEADEEADPLYQSHHFHKFLDTQSHHEIHPQSSHHFNYEVGSSSSCQGSGHEDLDLGLSLGSLIGDASRTNHPNVNLESPEIHDPNVDLVLGSSSRKKKGKSIWERGSSKD